MTLIELQDAIKYKSKPQSQFMLLNARALCSWLDVWLGLFLCKDAGDGFFNVSDFSNEPVVALEYDEPNSSHHAPPLGGGSVDGVVGSLNKEE